MQCGPEPLLADGNRGEDVRPAHRLKARRGPKKAIVAVATSILSTVYHLLRDGTVYQDLGMSHFDHMNRDRAAKSLVRRLQALGFEVDVRPAAA